MQLGKGISQSHGNKLLKRVRPHLGPDEFVVFICKCNNFRPMVDRVVVTDRRVMAMPTSGDEVPYSVGRNRIARVETGTSFGNATLTLATSDGEKTTFKQMKAEDAAEAAAHLRQPMSPPRPTPYAPSASSANSQGARTETVAEQLRQLGELHHEGVLSDDEFVSAKAKLLGQPAPPLTPTPPGYLGLDNREYYGAGQAPAPAPSTSSIDVNTATADQLVAHLAVSSDVATRVIQARSSGRFADFEDLVKQTGLAPHEAVRFRGRVTYGLFSQPRPSRPSGRVIDI